MKIIHTTALTDQQKNQVRSLVEICKQKEPVSLSAPSEDGLDYFLAYDHEDSLAGFLFLYFTDDQICECTAFTAPDHRKQGVFTKLLNMALDAADAYEKEEKKQVDFCFLIDENTPSSMAVMELLEAEYWYSEYKMARACRPEDRNISVRSTDSGKAGCRNRCQYLRSFCCRNCYWLMWCSAF